MRHIGPPNSSHSGGSRSGPEVNSKVSHGPIALSLVQETSSGIGTQGNSPENLS